MGHPVVQTTDPGMSAIAGEFGNKVTEFTGDLRSVNTEMAALQATWKGEASGKFNAAMDLWETSFQRVINALSEMMEAMGANVGAYRQQEDDASSAAQAFGSFVPGA